ncbi:MAG TPA: gamma-glutamyltransferase family protein [Vicinamibacterales bacterium]|nr:gamma-glutamyltransferase family protein [Vicinamibacterales bacterium]
MRSTSARFGFVVSFACAALVVLFLGRDIVSGQNNQNDLVVGAGQAPAPMEGRGRNAPAAKPGAPAPIVGGIRPPVIGSSGGVSSGHNLTSAAALEMLLKGGNAYDAGVAGILTAGVVEEDLFGLGGEALVLVYPMKEKKVTAIVGQGWEPKGASIEYFKAKGLTELPNAGLDPSVVPGAVYAALTVLERWGTMSFEQVSARAIQYCEEGFPLRPRMAETIARNLDFFKSWPDNAKVWLKPDGSMYAPGELVKLPGLAHTLRRMVEAERQAKKKGRSAGIVAARDRFYKGDIAREMVAFLQAHGAPYELSDFSEFFAPIEEPASTTYKGYTVYKHGFGSQGPSLLQSLNILENFDLRAMGHDSADYIHTLIETMKLSYADRDTYYADQAFVKSPVEGLLSKAYAKQRAAMIDPHHASKMLIAGDPMAFDSKVKTWTYWKANETATEVSRVEPMPLLLASAGIPKDTTHISVIDKEGNIFDVTPSGGWISGCVVLGDTGIQMSSRGEQFFLDPKHANHVEPRARPRYTLTPSIVLKDGKPFMAIGTPGGDNQDQTILQAFLDIVEFWDDWYPNLHVAFAWPRAQTMHFYGSVSPHKIGFNRMNIEKPIPTAVFDELKKRGHDVTFIDQYGVSGCATAVMIDPATGNRLAGADARRDCYAMAY